MGYIKRGKNKIKPDYGIKDFFNYYKDNAKEPILDYNKFVSIWKDCSHAISKLIIYRNLDFSIPARLGNLQIRKLKSKVFLNPDGSLNKNKLAINYKASWEKWIKEYPNLTNEEIAKLKDKKPVYHLNEHTDGYRVKWVWDKFTATIKNQSIYSLKMTRQNKQELSKAIKNYKTDYYEYDK